MSNLDPGHAMEWKQKQKYHTLGHNSSIIQYKNMMTAEKQNIEHIVKVVINMVFIKSMNFAKGGLDP
jgi:hypothetical protein